MTKDPTVLFCVGATKAGTSWFYRYLVGHPDCRMRSIKELHYFDALTPDIRQTRIAKNITTQERLSENIDGADPVKMAQKLIKIADREHLNEVFGADDELANEAYLEYLHGTGGPEKLVGDITPSYALLPDEQLQRMTNIASDVRFIYLLRDPVDRLWSHIRMVASRKSEGGILTRENADAMFAQVLGGNMSPIETRGDYRSAVEKLRAVVQPNKLMFAFFEDLFRGDCLGRICDFLGISRHPAISNRVIHLGRAMPMLEEQRAQAREWLASQYDFVRANFQNIPAEWQYDLKKVPA